MPVADVMICMLLRQRKPRNGGKALPLWLRQMGWKVRLITTRNSCWNFPRQSALAICGGTRAARRVLRRTDTAILHDLHPQEFDALHGGVGGDTRFELRREDGLAGLQQLNDAQSDKVPAFALIDPSYENKGEFGEVLDRVKALRQLSVVMVWYPQLTDDRHGALEKWLSEHAELSRFQFKALDPAATAGTKMYGSGMGLVLNNVPHDLAKALRRQMKLITKSLAVWRLSVPADS